MRNPVAPYLRKIDAKRRDSSSSLTRATAAVVATSIRWRFKRLKDSKLVEPRLVRAQKRRLIQRAERGRANGVEYLQLGSLHHAAGDVKRAHRCWTQAVELNSELLEAYEVHAYDLWHRGYWDEAYERFERWVEAQRAMAKRQQLDQLPITWLDMGFTFVIGTLAFLDTYVKQRLLAGEPLDRTLIVRNPAMVGNQCYLDYWREYLPNYICNEEAYETLRELRRLLRLHHLAWVHPDGRMLTFQQAGVETERQWEAEGRSPLLRLSESHRQRGWDTLEKLGVPAGAWFVTLHVREAWYHDLRNAEVSTYLRAIERVVERGGWVIRMGDRSMPRLPSLPSVIDYAHSDAKSDWMDVFLWAECRFLIGTASGPVQVPETFGVPVVQTNWCPLGLRYWFSDDLCLPKRYRRRGGGSDLSFEEAISSRVGYAMLSEELDALGVEAVDNTPEEIEEIVLEMLSRLDGVAAYTDEDEALQERFQRLEPPFHYPAPAGRARLGREFLRANARLLGG